MKRMIVAILLTMALTGCAIKTLPGVDCLLIDGPKAISVTCDWSEYKR